MRKGWLAAAVVLGCGALAGHARASVTLTVVFDALVEESSAAAVVTPIETSTVWEGARIVTYTHARVDEVLAGSCGGEVWIRTLGGVLGDVGQQVEGEAVFSVGSRYAVFLKPSLVGGGAMAVTARMQGEFPLHEDAAIHSLRVASTLRAGTLSPSPATVLRLQPHAALAPEAVQPAFSVLAGKSLDETRKLVASAWQRTHAQK